MAYIIILSANSDMARACAAEYAAHGYNLYLISRDINKTTRIANDLKIRYSIDVNSFELDILDSTKHKALIEQLFSQTEEKQPLGLITFTGYLGEQQSAQQNFNEAEKIIDTNFTSLVSFCEMVAAYLERKQQGFIVGVSSVAGDRGRQSNYIYGSAKAAYSTYLSGLRNRLSKSHVHVLTVKPGFVNTQMTQHLDLPPLLTAQPEQVAKDIFKAQQKNKNILYTKWVWFLIMLIIRNIPERIFKKTNL